MPKFYLSPSRIARYYFHECDRYLRYASTPKARREEEGVPPLDLDFSLVTRAILEGGYRWEEKVIADHLGELAVIAESDGDGPLHETRHGLAETLTALRNAVPGEAIYQPTLRPPPGFYQHYGLDRDLVGLTDCYPDLLMIVSEDSGPEVRVVDVKASDMMKLSHRIQVGLYALILESMLESEGIDLPVSRTGGVWLYEQPEPEWFPLVNIIPPLETFLTSELTPILEAPAEDAFWHVYFRCEWCDYYTHCRQEADDTDDVSLVPYLSTFAKRHLSATAGVRTVEDLNVMLQQPDADLLLDGCASLEGRAKHLRQAIDALRTGTETPTGAASISMPKGEQLRLILTLQSEPLSGSLYGYAINRVFGKDLYDSGTETLVGVARASDQETIRDLHRRLVGDLMGILRPAHDHNAGTDDWASQKSVQTYVFDSYERDLLTDTLFEAILDPEVAEDALALLFYFQRPELVEAEDHPANEVFFPIVVLTRVAQALFALPIPIAYRFADVVAALQPSQYGFDYRHQEFFSFHLSNRLKSNAIFEVWHQDRDDLLDSIERELKARVWAANSVINGIKGRLTAGELFAWPPKFALPPGTDFRDPLLSRLAFITRYESILGYLGTREGRGAPEDERLADEATLRVTYLGDGRYQLAADQLEADVSPSSFWNWILTCDTDDGRRGRLAYNDFHYRTAWWAPKNLAVALTSVTDVTEAGVFSLDLKHGEAFTPPAVGEVAFLEPRFTDWTTANLISELALMDDEPDPWFSRLVLDPLAARSTLRVPRQLRTTTLDLATRFEMTPSQQAALQGVLDHNVQLVWGPPGTGKTHFLALSVLCMLEAHRRAGKRLRVLLTAFTHTAIDNLLRKLVDLQDRYEVVGGEFRLSKLDPGGSGPVETVDPKGATEAVDQDLVVFGATVWQARKTSPENLNYDLVVIDEGSQLKVAEAAIAVNRLAAGGRLVIAGDDKQLPPIIQGEYPTPEGMPPLHGSILECLRDGDPEDVLTRALVENFRMCDVLCEYPRWSIYPEQYLPASDEVAGRRLSLNGSDPADELVRLLLDPDRPMALCVMEDVRATSRNPVEADLTAQTAIALQELLEVDDEVLWGERLFIVSPHHAQIRLIRRALAAQKDWNRTPFVDTVDKMQGQERDAVIVSYGVSDVETALREKEFIYSLNRLNVSITRARMKTALFLPRPLLEPPIQALDVPDVAEGVAYMQGLMHWCREQTEPVEVTVNGNRMTVYRG